MKKIIRIAKVELAGLFYSPIAWIVIILFIIQVGMDFSERLIRFEAEQFIGRQTLGLTNWIFTINYPNAPDISGFLRLIQEKMFLYIPLITMGLMSREISSGSIKLLLSSPVKIRDIILGKFLSMMVFGLALVAVLFLYTVAGMFVIENMDWSAIIGALAGLYLLICTYSAIGLFISSLTPYQIMAAISTFVLFGVINYMGLIWQDHDFFRDITHNVSIAGRIDYFLDGLITTREIIYFLSIITFFLIISMLRLIYIRNSTAFPKRFLGYTALALLLIGVGFASSRPGFIGYWDLTYTQRNTLSVEGQKTLARIKGPLQVTTYTNVFAPWGDFEKVKPASRYADLKHLEFYQRFKPDMEINYVYYYDTIQDHIFKYNPGKNVREVAEIRAEALDQDLDKYLTPDQVRAQLPQPDKDGRILRELKIGDKKTLLSAFFVDFIGYAMEAEYMASIKRLLDKPGQLRFVTGHVEKDPFMEGDRECNYAYANRAKRYSSINNGFDIDTISLKTEEIPDNLTALVIADPKLDYDSIELRKLRNYTDRGGNLIIMGEPRKSKVINALTEYLGIHMLNGNIMSKAFNDRFVEPDIFFLHYKHELVKGNNLGPYFSRGPGAFEVINDSLGFNIEITGVSDDDSSWFRPGINDLRDSLNVTFSTELGDVKKEWPALIKMTRKRNNKDQKILITGDADVFANKYIEWFMSFNLNTAALKWFTDGLYPATVPGIFPKDNRITANKQSAANIKWFFVAVVPAILFITCTVVLIRRKRK